VSPPDKLTTKADRIEARRRRVRRSVTISTVSTILVLGGLTALLVTSPGWHSVRTTFFSSSEFTSSFGDVASGFWLDIRLFVIVEAVVLVLGMLVAMCRVVRVPALFPLRLLAVVYVDLFRGLPVILVVYLIGFGIPALQLSGLPSDAAVLGGIALALCYAAYVAEVYRAGIISIHPSQSAAGLALGLTGFQTLRYVVIPQAVRRVAPPLLNDFISLQKDVALVSILGPQEAFRVAQIHEAANFNFTPLLAAGMLYLCVTIPLTRIVDRMQERTLRQQGGATALGAR
jgi:polar amino acid transport system permease protein